MPVFPITNHFYEMIKRTYILFGWFFLCFYLFNLFADIDYALLSLLSIISSFLILMILHIFTQVFHLLTSIMAIQKFLIFFFPEIESVVILRPNCTNYLIKFAYTIFGIKETVFIFTYLSRSYDFRNVYIIVFWTLNLFLIACSVLYIPIMISIKKFSHLPMARINQPQKYIFWQTMIILLFKIVSLPSAYTCWFYGLPPIWIVFFLITADIIITPLMIQTSYLYCNRRNVDAMFSSFKMGKFLRVIFDVKKERKAKVGPLRTGTLA
ncbi:hypothetical protein CAEBREN_21281 [Caenorhabditis brenneri]|uniref:Serpentine Receptor, class Z n=1 Tax=Caenorhabditis brenneri TaxID=135651 RepID=G0P2K7_CAEBE|nr:hypothetical protein CAEBREN_21281 [Caenorhabditis brenneri]